jgi:hypothetical protein
MGPNATESGSAKLACFAFEIKGLQLAGRFPLAVLVDLASRINRRQHLLNYKLSLDTGYRMIALGFDWSLLQEGIAAAVSGIQR